jgi:acetyltransferase-like isoleucine patch superfamily enzyme
VGDFRSKIGRALLLPWHDRLNTFHGFWVRLKTTLYYRRVLGALGHGCKIDKPLLLSNPRFIQIGDRTLIGPGARIEALVLDESHPPSLIIGSNVNIEQNVHIICSSRIVIGDNVSITGHCAIVDTIHPYSDVNDPRKIGDRIDPNPSPVEIGEGTFIGYGSVILPNVRIGRNCVIGTNSTVIRDIPDYCVVSGNPASIIKRYDFEKKTWNRELSIS